jgi:hypothetical protein
MKKSFTEEIKVCNRLFSDLSNAYSDIELDQFTKEDLMRFFSTILQDANIDTNIIVRVLESHHSTEAKEQALTIKINEGW